MCDTFIKGRQNYANITKYVRVCLHFSILSTPVIWLGKKVKIIAIALFSKFQDTVDSQLNKTESNSEKSLTK